MLCLNIPVSGISPTSCGNIPARYTADVATVGENLRRYRKALRPKVNQEQLGEILGVGQSLVSKWESDLLLPSTEVLPLLAGTLGVMIDSIFDGVDRASVLPRHADSVDSHQLNKKRLRQVVMKAQTPNVGEGPHGTDTRAATTDPIVGHLDARIRQLEELHDRFAQQLGTLAAVSKAVTKRAAAFVNAPDPQRSAVASTIQPASPRVPRRRDHGTGRKSSRR
jgi:transcriptional regulator with XRE-family HTH domain